MSGWTELDTRVWTIPFLSSPTLFGSSSQVQDLLGSLLKVTSKSVKPDPGLEVHLPAEATRYQG